MFASFDVVEHMGDVESMISLSVSERELTRHTHAIEEGWGKRPSANLTKNRSKVRVRVGVRVRVRVRVKVRETSSTAT